MNTSSISSKCAIPASLLLPQLALPVAMVCLVSGYVAFRLSPSSRLVAALSSWGGFDGRQATGQVQMLKQLLSVDSSWAL